MTKQAFFLCALLLITLLCDYSRAVEVYPRRQEQQLLFDIWKRNASAYSEPERKVRTQQRTTWIGDFQRREKQEIFSFIENQSEFGFIPILKILKTDLQMGGKPDYVIQELFIKNPQPYHYGAAFVVLTRMKESFDLRILSLSGYERGGSANSPLDAVDLNGDGLKEIIIGWQQEGDPENPTGDDYRNVIYKNESGSFGEVYERKTYDYLKITDLDGNGIPEILEAVDEYEGDSYAPNSNWQWVNVYNMTKAEIELTSQRYPKFYEQKKKGYQKLIKEAQEKEMKSRKPDGLCADGEPPGEVGCTIYVNLEKALQSYIQRIDAMLRSGTKGK